MGEITTEEKPQDPDFGKQKSFKIKIPINDSHESKDSTNLNCISEISEDNENEDKPFIHKN